MRIVKAIGASIGVVLCFFYLGCGGMQMAQAGVPNISQVVPQTLAAGSGGATVKIVGSNFTDPMVVLWNGSPLNTTVVDDNTLASPVESASLSVPGIAQLQVKNSLTGKISPAVKVSISSATSTSSSPSLTISTASLPSGTTGKSYSAVVAATGGTPAYTWKVTHGSLPPGLSLSTDGSISGTPTASGSYSFNVNVKDSGRPAQTVSATLSIQISAGVSALQTSNTTLPSGTYNAGYSYTLQANGGTPSYSWSLTSGSLPAGLTLSSTGVVSGTPTATGTFTFTATVHDSSNPVQTASSTNTLVVSAAGLKIATTSLAGATSGQSYSQTLQVSGGTPSYQWSISSGSLPAGLTLSSAGVISGTPSSNGASSFAVKVTDSSSPSQSATATFSIAVAPSALSVTVPTMPAVTLGAPYSQALQASGGSSPYNWKLASGSLPPGLSLSTTTGVISGMVSSTSLSSNYTYNFSVAVTDSESTPQTASASGSVTLNATVTPLSITSSSLPSGTAGSSYSGVLQATGGTPAYTWSITSGSLPTGLTLAATTGTISGTPTTSGTSTFTATVTDNGNPAQTQSVPFTISVSAPQSTAGTTWYVRPDGGTRYSSNATSGQCDGQADLPYQGTGVNQHCAFKDFRMLYTDGSYTYGDTFPGWGWVIHGGDTVIIRGSIADGVSYRVGWNSASTYCDSTGCWGITGSPNASGTPPPPSGTPTQHTRILGGNYGACTAQNARTQLHGGWSVGAVLGLNGASYVDVACLDITDFSNCGRDADAVACQSNGQAVSDYANIGITLNNTSTHITLTDIRIHGMAADGISGAPGDGFVANDIAIVGNADAGWNADDGSGTTGVGSTLVQNFDISWNGCVEEYPIVDPVPYFSCRDQSTGGYGDGFGTASLNSPAPGWQVHFDQGTVAYNTQDGLDALHIGGAGSSMAETRVLAYGNEGQQLKVGGATATIQNSLVVGNCNALTQTIPGRPVPTQDSLGSLCRAGNTAVLVTTSPGYTTKFQDNTVFEAGSIGVEVEYATGDQGQTNVFQYNNNVFIGFYNSGAQANPTPIYSNTNLNMLTNPGASWTNNAYYGSRNNWSCPGAGESSARCGDPGLADETFHQYGYGNMAPSSSSSAVAGAGVTLPSITVDYTGQTRPNPPSIGGYELP